MHAVCIKYINHLHLPGMAGTTELLAGVYGVPCEMKYKITQITFFMQA